MGLARARTKSWITGIAAVAVMLLVLSACGGSSSNSSSSPASASSSSQTSQTTQSAAQFKAAITPVINDFKNASNKIGTALEKAGSQTDSQLATTFQQLATTWTAAVTKLEALQPPPEFTAAYNRLKSEVSKAKADLTAIVSAAQNHDAAAAKTATTKLVNDIVSAKATSTTLTNNMSTLTNSTS